MTDRVESYLAREEIHELSCRYMRGLDRLDGALLLAQFWHDGWCEYGFFNGSPSEFVVFAMQALATHRANQHMLGQTLIDIDGHEAFGEVYFRAYHQVETPEGLEDLVIAGRYLDRYERRDGLWKLAYRSEIVDWSHSGPSNASYFELAPDCLRGGRQDDAVYRRDNRYRPSDTTD
ncbi:MAG: nuclear transport factor 2 family protein [Halioglobus sp.]|nr:nuclear transport factor 2 family protein [Halioglobus sp.]